MPFEVGAVVMLRSGGPRMTVKSIEDSQVTCVWQDIKGNLHERVFEAAMLADGGRSAFVFA